MSPPKWFWVVLAVCVLLATAAYAWNIWHDNNKKTFSEMTREEKRAYINK